MTNEEMIMCSVDPNVRRWIKNMQIGCGCCRCYGIENCGEHAKLFRQRTGLSKGKL